MIEWLVYIFSKVYEQEEMTDEWQRGVIYWIYKRKVIKQTSRTTEG